MFYFRSGILAILIICFEIARRLDLKKTLFQHMDEVAKSTSANERVMKFGLIEKELMYHVLFFFSFFDYSVAALESPFWKEAPNCIIRV